MKRRTGTRPSPPAAAPVQSQLQTALGTLAAPQHTRQGATFCFKQRAMALHSWARRGGSSLQSLGWQRAQTCSGRLALQRCRGRSTSSPCTGRGHACHQHLHQAGLPGWHRGVHQGRGVTRSPPAKPSGLSLPLTTLDSPSVRISPPQPLRTPSGPSADQKTRPREPGCSLLPTTPIFVSRFCPRNSSSRACSECPRCAACCACCHHRAVPFLCTCHPSSAEPAPSKSHVVQPPLKLECTVAPLACAP